LAKDFLPVDLFQLLRNPARTATRRQTLDFDARRPDINGAGIVVAPRQHRAANLIPQRKIAATKAAMT
jgi:hypothetical protein